MAERIHQPEAEDRYARRCGHDHLRWGEALLRIGCYAEARVQFEAARGLDLSLPDRAAMNVFPAHSAKGPLNG